MSRPYNCPACGSTRSTWKGYRQTRTGKMRLRKCKDCGRKYTPRQTIDEEPTGELPCPTW